MVPAVCVPYARPSLAQCQAVPRYWLGHVPLYTRLILQGLGCGGEQERVGVCCSNAPAKGSLAHIRVHVRVMQLTLDTRDVFIECTATDLAKARIVLNTVTTMFSEYCSTPFEVEPVEVVDASGESQSACLALRHNVHVEPLAVQSDHQQCNHQTSRGIGSDASCTNNPELDSLKAEYGLQTLRLHLQDQIHVMYADRTLLLTAVYPQLSSREMEVSVRQVCGYIGIKLDASQVRPPHSCTMVRALSFAEARRPRGQVPSDQ